MKCEEYNQYSVLCAKCDISVKESIPCMKRSELFPDNINKSKNNNEDINKKMKDNEGRD